MGLGIALSRWSPPQGAGHIGWAIELEDGTYLAGATEGNANLGECATEIPSGHFNGAWTRRFANRQQMLDAFASGRVGPPYDFWKAYEVATPNYDSAKDQARLNKARGYKLIDNNCLDHATDVLAAYGVPWQALGGSPADGMPWKETHPAPINWLDAWRLPLHALDRRTAESPATLDSADASS